MRIRTVAGLALALPVATVLAQTPAFQIGVVYQCRGGQSFKVISCAGLADSDWCDVQFYVRGQPQMRSKSTRRQITAAIPLCQAHTVKGAGTSSGSRGC